MKFLVDESVEYRVVEFLRSAGHDVASIAEDAPSTQDAQVLSRARRAKRILLTNDKDFGTLVFFDRHPHVGVILMRLPKEDASSKINKLRLVLSRYGDILSESFIVITQENVRVRRSKSGLVRRSRVG